MGDRVDYTGRDWQPGDPIWARPSGTSTGGFLRKMFSIEQDGRNSPDCACADAATWPYPPTRQNLYGHGYRIPLLDTPKDAAA